jgi:hypothetical protein
MFRSVQIHSTASISPTAKKDTRSERVSFLAYYALVLKVAIYFLTVSISKRSFTG